MGRKNEHHGQSELAQKLNNLGWKLLSEYLKKVVKKVLPIHTLPRFVFRFFARTNSPSGKWALLVTVFKRRL